MAGTGTGDALERSSSPLKRRASDLEAEVSGNPRDDAAMSSVAEGDTEMQHSANGSSRHQRGVSVDMLAGENSGVVVETVEGADGMDSANNAEQSGKENTHVFGCGDLGLG